VSEVIAALLIVAGSLFCLIAAVGMVRLPDTLIRMHAATKAGTLGAGLILAAAAVCYADVGMVLRALLTLVFLYLTAPVAAHLIGRAAYRSGIELFSRTCIDHLGDDMGTPLKKESDCTR
jgi:multicomponent Na+:H+ antiporter subunit G